MSDIENNDACSSKTVDVARPDLVDCETCLEKPKKPRSKAQVEAFARCREALLKKKTPLPPPAKPIPIVKATPKQKKERRVLEIPPSPPPSPPSPPPEIKKKKRNPPKRKPREPTPEESDSDDDYVHAQPRMFQFNVV